MKASKLGVVLIFRLHRRSRLKADNIQNSCPRQIMQPLTFHCAWLNYLSLINASVIKIMKIGFQISEDGHTCYHVHGG